MDPLWVITALLVCVIFWMIIAHLQRKKRIDEYLERADPVLLQKGGVEVVFQAPQGSFFQPYTLMMVETPVESVPIEQVHTRQQ